MKMNKKGFTLAELLIVIAIIAVLIAIAIPVFSGQLDNAKLQADHANLRSAYAISQTINLLGPSSEIIDGYNSSSPAFTATYGTDGQFHVTASTPVTIQAENGKHSGNGSSGTGSCKSCVVDCSAWNTKGQNIIVNAVKADGSVATDMKDVVNWVLAPNATSGGGSGGGGGGGI